jgi:hypothetical protein
MADVPAIRITAVDQASAVINQVSRSLGGFAAQILSVAAVTESLRRSLDLGDELKRMQDTLGLSIGKLDQLSIVAKLNGASLDDMAKGFKFLGSSMIEAQTSSSQSARLFSALGVSVKDASGNLRGVDAVMGDTAKALSSIENETVRAAVGTAIFGKSYLQIAATLRNYSEDQERANLVLEKFGGVSQTAANLADDLSDKFTMLGEGSKRALLGALVPGMAAVSAGIDALINSGGRLQSGFGQVVSGVAEWVTGSLIGLKGTFEVVGVSIAGVMASIATGSLEPLRAAREDIKKIFAETAAAQAAIRTAAKFPGLDDGDQISRAASANERLNKTMADQAAIAKILAPAQKQVADGTKEWEKALREWNEQAKLMEQALKAWEKAEQDAREELFKAIESEQKQIEQIRQSTAGYQKQADSINFTTEQLLKKEQARLIELANNLRATEGAGRLAEAYDEQAAAIGRLLDANNSAAFKKSLEEQEAAFQRTYDSISNTITDALMRGFESGKDWAKNFIQTLKNMFATLVLRPIIQGIVAPLAGALAGGVSGTANAAGGVGNLFSSGASLASSAAGGISSIFGASGFTAGLAGDAFLPGALAGGLGGAELGAMLTPIVGALPWVGIAAIAIPAIAKLFDKGPASRTGTFSSGAASLISDPSRDSVFQGSSAFGAFGISKDFWLGPEAGAAFKPTLDAITQLDNTIAGMVGADATGAITAALAGHSITVGLGKEGTDLNASGGPGAILKDRYVTVLTAIDKELGAVVANFAGSGEELANLVIGLVSLNENLTAAADGFEGINTELDKAADRTAMDVFREQGDALDKLMENFDGSTSATLGLVQASNAYYDTAVALIGQIRDITMAIDTMFAGTRENIYLAGRDNDFVYQYLQKQADEKMGLLGTLSDPAAIAKTAQEINDGIVKAFGLLDPASQSALRDQFLAGIDQVNKAANDRLAELGTTVGSAAKSDLQQVKDLLGEIATKMGAAADKQSDAADTQLAAAQTPIQVAVTVTNSSGQEVFSGGGG